MRAPQLEQLDSLDHRDEFRSRAVLQAAIKEAFALLNAGARQEAIAQIKQYADLAARSNAGCYIFGLIYFNAGDLRHALTWFDRALALQPGFPEALSARTIVSLPTDRTNGVSPTYVEGALMVPFEVQLSEKFALETFAGVLYLRDSGAARHNAF